MKKILEQNWLLWLIIALGAFFRFYKLDWGEGYFFHPDEYHIAAAVNRLVFPSQMNPELFSYGSFTVYLIYFTKLIFSILDPRSSILNPILIGRFYSALFSTLTIIFIYLISLKLFTFNFSLLTAALCAAMPGLTQQAHFTTPESILTFWLFLTLYLWMKWSEEKRLKFIYFSAVSLGLALGTKIVAVTFLPILVLLPLTNLRLKTPPRLANAILGGGEKTIKLFLLPLLITFLAFFLVFPYALLDYQSFRNTTIYETGVGRGEPLVFYTRQFINTTPILFQYQKILPYTLGPAVLILGSIGFLLMLIKTVQPFIKRKLLITPAKGWSASGRNYSLLITAFLSYFLPNVFLFAKWTRFLAPAFPFFAIFTVYLLSKIKNNVLRITYCVLLISNALWTFMFFSIYLRPDVRITATEWINNNFPLGSVIFTEQGNMIEVPLEGGFKKTSLDFYGLEESLKIQQQLPQFLAEADYFIVQSRRLFLNHQRLPGQFPKTAKFYNLLFSGRLGFEKIKEFSPYPQFSIFPGLAFGSPRAGNFSAKGGPTSGWQFSIPDEVGEETWSVFDHPVIRIYQKVKPLPKGTYEKLLAI